MSWNITHQCRFQSRTGQQYCVNISKQADTGQNIVQLQGSEHPFVTSEANGDDIFMPIRQQTGYLRVLDNSGGTLIDELLPENNTQKMVTLVNLTTGKTEWIGFLAAEVFTQPWGNDLTELEFPLKSALACLSDVTIQTGVTGTNRLALLVYNAISSVFGDGNVPFTEIVLMDDFKTVCDGLLIRANFEIFFRDETIMNENTETVVRVGSSYMDAIKDMCQVFGLTLRQQGTSLIFGRYDDGTGFPINVNVMDWSILATVANRTDTWPDIQPQGQIITKELLPITEFRGSNNKLTFVQGGKTAVVTLNLADSTRSNNVITMPQSKIQEGNTRRAAVGSDGNPYLKQINQNTYGLLIYVGLIGVQGGSTYYFQMDTSERNNESFTYLEAIVSVYEKSTSVVDNRYIVINKKKIVGSWAHSTRDALYNDSVFNNWGPDNYNRWMKTGAIPGRWGKDGNTLENGLFLVQHVIHTYDQDTTPQACYSIWNDEDVEMSNCFLNINFNIEETFISILNQYTCTRNEGVEPYISYFTPTEDASYMSFVNSSFNLLKNSIEYSMVCRLNINVGGTNYYWTGSAWQTSESNFTIPVKGGSIVSNYDQNMNVDNIGGIFIWTNYTGKVTFEIMNIVYSNSMMSFYDNVVNSIIQRATPLNVEMPVYPFQKILSGLSIDIVYSRDVTVSPRSSNIYRKTIIGMGFSEEKAINLDLGTWNNNLSSPSLLRKHNNEEYVQTIDYTASDGSTVMERPEMHLLNRMVEYYKTMRRTMEAKIATGIDLFRNRFSYNGRKYMAIDKKHDWEREEQEVKFIEVT